MMIPKRVSHSCSFKRKHTHRRCGGARLVVQVGRGSQEDGEGAGRTVGVVIAPHGQRAPHVLHVAELPRHRLGALLTLQPRQRGGPATHNVRHLRNKPLVHPEEVVGVVGAQPAELQDVFHRLWGHVRVEGELKVAECRLQDEPLLRQPRRRARGAVAQGPCCNTATQQQGQQKQHPRAGHCAWGLVPPQQTSHVAVLCQKSISA